ncbi:MAG: hypothetical protein U9R19_05460 [Bacteroidota bacterium]|nr:hypothetical protein [Bacteroidota bacterium]
MSKSKKPSNPNSGSNADESCDTTTQACPLDCPSKIEFKEHNTVYGFDDYTNSDVPWKSVEKDKSDTVKAKISPGGKFANVQFTSSNASNVTVSPSSPSSGSQVVKVTGAKKGESEIKAGCGGSNYGKIKVKSYSRKSKTVAVRLVHEKNYTSTDISDATIKSYLKKVYEQAVFEFKITRLPAKTVEFDLNKDGKIDVGSWMSAEMRKIRDECKDDSYDHNIFLVDKPNDGSLGYMSFNQRYGFVHTDNSNHPGNTVAHELGHGSFGLVHPDQKTPADNDKKNIMHSDEPSPWRLRKNQWDKINP